VSTGEDRQRIVESAKYLRGVRPLDPEELADYVDGGAHPAVVARVLREAAPELGVVERADGTFIPGTVRRVPAPYVRRVEDRLVERYGLDWHRGDSGDRLRAVIRRLKEDYYRNRDVAYDEDVALGSAVYHLGDFYAALQYVLEAVAGAGLLDRELRVLDVGAGVGGPALGLHDYVFGPPGDPNSGEAPDAADPDGGTGRPDGGGHRGATDRRRDPAAGLVDYHAVEPSAAADVFESVVEETVPNFRTTVHRDTAEAFDPDGEYDLVLFANVLNELDDPAGVARRYLDVLAPEGSLVAMAPADRETSVGLRTVERSIESAGATVFAPEVRLWPDATPTDEGWSFDERPAIETPPVQRKLDEAGGDDGEFEKTAVRYSYAVLRTDGRERFAFVPSRARFARLADSEAHVTDRVDLVAVKLSRNLAEDGHPLFRVGDGSQSVDHYAVLTRETTLNRALATAGYGDLLSFESVLVLWNDDEGAYNLVVDEETVVDRVPA
jgi:SAM-dependent methyltransferase